MMQGENWLTFFVFFFKFLFFFFLFFFLGGGVGEEGCGMAVLAS